MARGRLEAPDLDDRTWEEIVAQARALIPTYAPNWTDHNPSDLGITLIELFAWLVEGMIFRLNRVPDKHLIEFLNLIGVTRDPPTPASTYLTYRLAPDADALVVPKGHQVSTPQTEEKDAVVFEADQELRVLRVNLTTALLLFADPATPGRFVYRNVSNRVVASPLGGLSLLIPASDSVMLALGFDAASSETIALRARLSRPVRRLEAQITWHHSRGDLPPLPDAGGDWTDLSVLDLRDGTDGFQKNGIVRFSVPAPWDSQSPADWNIGPMPGEAPVDDRRCWAGVMIRNLTTQPLALGIEHLLFNALPATNALTVAEPELLGQSSGQPFQFFALRNRPLYKELGSRDPYAHLRVQVREPLVGGGFGPWADWRLVEDFPAGAGKVFRLLPVVGEVGFGNHDPTAAPDGHGSIPPAGSEIRAASYRYVAGDASGNVPADTITVIRAALTGVVEVRNPGPATGGSDEEAIEETKRRAPEVLRTRDRAVTAQDYEYLAREATTDVRRARCLPERLFREFDPLPPGARIGDPWTFGGLNRNRGNVNVIIIPDAPPDQPTPRPSSELLREVADHLDARRVVGIALGVTGPRYLPINAQAKVSIWSQALQTGLAASVEEVVGRVRTRITQFLHPLYGGADGAGWEVGQVFLISGLLEFIQPSAEVGFISSLTVAAGRPLYDPPDRPIMGQSDVWVQLADYEIICSGDHTIVPLVL
jgi:predicted phage baseplate assembly protein